MYLVAVIIQTHLGARWLHEQSKKILMSVVVLIYSIKDSYVEWHTHVSGIAKLGHTGAPALATRACAPPMQVRLWIIGADSSYCVTIAVAPQALP